MVQIFNPHIATEWIQISPLRGLEAPKRSLSHKMIYIILICSPLSQAIKFAMTLFIDIRVVLHNYLFNKGKAGIRVFLYPN